MQVISFKVTSEEFAATANPQCPNFHSIKLICCQIGCQGSSLHCSNQQCSYCSLRHDKCLAIPIQKWLNIIKQKSDESKQIRKKLLNQQIKIIEKMASIINQSLRAISFGWMPEKYADILTKIFMDKQNFKLHSTDASDITQYFHKLTETPQINIDCIQDMLKQFGDTFQQYAKSNLDKIKNIYHNSFVNSQISFKYSLLEYGSMEYLCIKNSIYSKVRSGKSINQSDFQVIKKAKLREFQQTQRGFEGYIQHLSQVAQNYIKTTRGQICKDVIHFLSFVKESQMIQKRISDPKNDNNLCKILLYDVALRLMRDMVY